MKSIFVYSLLLLLYGYYQVTSTIINYHILSSAISIKVDWWVGTTSLMLYAFSIYRRVRLRSYYFIYITITYTIMFITIMRYAYIIYFITITYITIIIIHYFRKNFGYFFRPYLVPFYA